MGTKTKIEWTSEKIVGMLAERHKEVFWAFFSELRSFTGFQTRRSVRSFDAYAVHTWPSKRILIAYEVKVSRPDLLNELNNPQKRTDALNVSNEFYFVTPPGIVKDGELPENCGHLQAGLNGFRVMKKATWRGIEDLQIDFTMSLLRSSSEKKKFHKSKIFKFAGIELNVEDFAKEFESQMDWNTERKIKNAAKKRTEELKTRVLELTADNNRLQQNSAILDEIFGEKVNSNDLTEMLRTLAANWGSSHPVANAIEMLNHAATALSAFQKWREGINNGNK